MGCRNETHEVENCREDTQFVNKIMAREKNDITKRVLIATRWYAESVSDN